MKFAIFEILNLKERELNLLNYLKILEKIFNLATILHKCLKFLIKFSNKI